MPPRVIVNPPKNVISQATATEDPIHSNRFTGVTLPEWMQNIRFAIKVAPGVCGKQNNEYALDEGTASPGCNRLSAGACELEIEKAYP